MRLYAGVYRINRKTGTIFRIIEAEEDKFQATIEQGSGLLEEEIRTLKRKDAPNSPGNRVQTLRHHGFRPI